MLSTSKSDETSIRVVTFSGKKEDWIYWEEKFLARARRKDLKELYTCPPDDIPKSKDKSKKGTDDDAILLRKQNDLAYSDLILSIDLSTTAGKVAFGLVKSSKTKDYEDGNAAISWKQLKSKYQPDTAAQLSKLHKQFYGARLKQGQDPDVWMTELEDVRLKMAILNSEMTDDQFLMHVTTNLTLEYDTAIDIVGRKIGDSNDPLTIDVLREELSLKYERSQDRKHDTNYTDDKKEDHALYAGGKFKGKCNRCGKQGHKSKDCYIRDPSKRPNKGNSNNNGNQNNKSTNNNNTNNNGNGNRVRFQGKCNYFQKPGHKEEECYSKIRDQKNDQANATQDDLCAMSFDTDSESGCCPQCGLQGPSFQEYLRCSEDTRMLFVPRTGNEEASEENQSEDSGENTQNKTSEYSSENEDDYVDIDHSIELCLRLLQQGRGHPMAEMKSFFEMVLLLLKIDETYTSVHEFMNPSDSWEFHMRGINYVKSRVKLMTDLNIRDVPSLMKTSYVIQNRTFRGASRSWIDDDSKDITISQEEYISILWVGVEWILKMWKFPESTEISVPMIDVAFRVTDERRRSMWLGDSGASCHMTCDDAGMFDCKNIKSYIKVGDGKTVMASKIGKKKMTVIQQNGESMDIILQECKYVPGLFTNLFSITKALTNNWNLSNKGELIVLNKGNSEIIFDQIIKTENGQVLGIEMVPRDDHGNLSIEKGKIMDINEFHKSYGHVNFQSLRKTANYYGIKLKGEEKQCYECSLAKIRQKNVKKETGTRSKVPGERLFIDISSTKAKSYGGSRYWILIVDDCTDICWSIFVKKKSDMPEKVIELISKLKQNNKYNVTHIVRYIRCDDAGENRDLENKCNDKGIGITFEYTGPGSPQFNGRVERKYPTLYARVQTILNAAGVPKHIREGVWAEAAKKQQRRLKI